MNKLTVLFVILFVHLGPTAIAQSEITRKFIQAYEVIEKADSDLASFIQAGKFSQERRNYSIELKQGIESGRDFLKLKSGIEDCAFSYYYLRARLGIIESEFLQELQAEKFDIEANIQTLEDLLVDPNNEERTINKDVLQEYLNNIADKKQCDAVNLDKIKLTDYEQIFKTNKIHIERVSALKQLLAPKVPLPILEDSLSYKVRRTPRILDPSTKVAPQDGKSIISAFFGNERDTIIDLTPESLGKIMGISDPKVIEELKVKGINLLVTIRDSKGNPIKDANITLRFGESSMSDSLGNSYIKAPTNTGSAMFVEANGGFRADQASGLDKLGPNQARFKDITLLSLEDYEKLSIPAIGPYLFEIGSSKVSDFDKHYFTSCQYWEGIGKHHPEYEIYLLGFSSTDGNKAFNETLSKKRAKYIKLRLVNDCSYNSNQLNDTGLGESSRFEGGGMYNRRVEFRVKKK